MSTSLKDLYTPEYVARLARTVRRHDPTFDAAAFERAVRGPGWNELELKARMRRIATCLHASIAGDLRRQLSVLQRVAPHLEGGGFLAMFFPDFVEVFGLDDFDASIPALELFTQHSSSEFAVRPFVVRYGPRMLEVFARWSAHESDHVRRLSSEGLRPRLPWAMALPDFKRDPAPVLVIITRLFDDPSEYVRRSVANNLNDIAKDHPQLVLELTAKHLGRSADTDRLLKHACRTMLKRGDPMALRLFGHDHAAEVEVSRLALDAKRIRIGESVTFSFDVVATEDAKVRVEYAIDFVKARGQTSRKVFKVAERELVGGEPVSYRRTHSFRDLTTRTHHAGRHGLAILINGVERATKSLSLDSSE